jgi:CobQ-like glutamine amidotransferase family enzyme
VTGQSSIQIGLLIPEVLGTYSDAGNATVLAQRACWRGIPAEIIVINADTAPPASLDVYLLGGGEDTAQLFAAQWLSRHTRLRDALTSRARTLAVCAGLQVLGLSMRDRSGHDHPGLGVLDITTAPGRHRAVGEIVTTCAIPGIGQLIGFENHHGVTSLSTDTRSLGTVVTGTGNGTRDHTGRRTEGVLTDRVIGTYLHGPILARNPALADHILGLVTGKDLTPIELPDQVAMRQTHPYPLPTRAWIRRRPRVPQYVRLQGVKGRIKWRNRIALFGVVKAPRQCPRRPCEPLSCDNREATPNNSTKLRQIIRSKTATHRDQ